MAIFTGPVDSTTTIPVFGAGDPRALPSEFAMYCFSGATSGESCNHSVVSTGEAQNCHATCQEGLTTLVGPRGSRKGDSGAPLYVKGNGGAFIRGHIIASSAAPISVPVIGEIPVVSVAVPWSKVSDEYGVDIVTGFEGVDMVPDPAGATG
ncbi:hypothetical protein [Streptomyces sp. AC555_RSS877]|uniref:hypothetical protein n=1 Tax=Streptomyces sp. AC555_RSS877 TaxID=2823688 RepID=UPI001C27D077|nr:hypothetical protein [Streptomyces sp. AC555_RSS877]